jgi:hypothetical protein
MFVTIFGVNPMSVAPARLAGVGPCRIHYCETPTPSTFQHRVGGREVAGRWTPFLNLPHNEKVPGSEFDRRAIDRPLQVCTDELIAAIEEADRRGFSRCLTR